MEFQSPYNRITYTIIGEGSAPVYFKIVPNSGAVQLSRSLRYDTTVDYVLLVQASDGGTPPKVDSTTVKIHVNRNNEAPKFLQTNIESTIFETLTLGEDFTSVRARDSDVQAPYNKVYYQLEENSDYFRINRESGGIYVQKALTDDPTKRVEYILKVIAFDEGYPYQRKSSNTATVRITIIRNLNPPVFLNSDNYKQSIKQTHDPAGSIISISTRDDDNRVSSSSMI